MPHQSVLLERVRVARRLAMSGAHVYRGEANGEEQHVGLE